LEHCGSHLSVACVRCQKSHRWQKNKHSVLHCECIHTCPSMHAIMRIGLVIAHWALRHAVLSCAHARCRVMSFVLSSLSPNSSSFIVPFDQSTTPDDDQACQCDRCHYYRCNAVSVASVIATRLCRGEAVSLGLAAKGGHTWAARAVCECVPLVCSTTPQRISRGVA